MDATTARSETDEFGRSLYDLAADGAVISAVARIAADRGVPRAQVALAWVLARPGVTAPIIGPRTMEQFEGGLRALELTLDAGQLARLDEIFPGYKAAPMEYAW